MSDIIRFYSRDPEIPCPPKVPYSLDQIWKFTDKEMEEIHNYIQWIFPTDDPRNTATGKPCISEEDIVAFNEENRNGIMLRYNLLKSYIKYLNFLGFELLNNNKIMPSKEYNIRKRDWMKVQNHNYLRITRMISSLKLLGLEEYAEELFSTLKIIYKENRIEIGETTMNFWKQAIDGKLPRLETKTQKELLEKLKNVQWGS